MVVDEMSRANKLTQLEGPRKVGEFGEFGEFGELGELGESGDSGKISPRLLTKEVNTLVGSSAVHKKFYKLIVVEMLLSTPVSTPLAKHDFRGGEIYITFHSTRVTS